MTTADILRELAETAEAQAELSLGSARLLRDLAAEADRDMECALEQERLQ